MQLENLENSNLIIEDFQRLLRLIFESASLQFFSYAVDYNDWRVTKKFD